MNPFELQAELTRQWLGLMSTAAAAVTEACLAAGRQSLNTLSDSSSRSLTAPSFTAPMLMPQWPFNPFQPDLFGRSNPYGAATPWTAWPMSMGAWPTTYGSFPFGATAWPFPGLPGLALPWGWPSPWSMAAGGFGAAFPGWRMGPPSAGEFMDQVATAYRSASGHAVAAVLGPMGMPLDPRTFGVPWWQAAGRRSA